MTSEIRINTLKNRVGLGTISLSSTGPIVSGITTLKDDVEFYGSSDSNTVKFDKSDNSLKFIDGAKAKFGTSNDLEVYHDGSHSHIREVGTGDLRLRSSKIQLMNENSQEYFVGTSGGSVELYHNDTKRFETSSFGAVVTGKLSFTNTGNTIHLADSQKLYLGNGLDFEFFHDGAENFIQTNNGNLRIRNSAENMARFIPNGGVELYHNNFKKLETTSTGALVHGTFNTTGNINVGDNVQIQLGNATNNDFVLVHDGTDNIINCGNNGNLFLRSDSTHIQSLLAEDILIAEADGAVKLFYDGSKKLETYNNGIIVYGPEGQDGLLNLYADEGDDHADKWRLQADTNGSFYLKNYASGSWETNIAAAGNGAVQLFHDNVLRLYTDADGVTIGQSTNAQLKVYGSVGNTIIKSSGAEIEFTRAASNNITCSNASGSLNINTAGSNTRLSITSGGTVQFKGDVNPQAEFDRGSANNTNINLKYNGTFTGQVSAANADFQLSAVGASTPISFYTNGGERLRIDTYGALRVGNTHTQTTSSNTKRIALGAKGSIWGWATGQIDGALNLADNYYWNGVNNIAIENDHSAYLTLRSGSLRFGSTNQAHSAGGNISTGIHERFRITNDGRVLIGTSSAFATAQAYRLFQIGQADGGWINLARTGVPSNGNHLGAIQGFTKSSDGNYHDTTAIDFKADGTISNSSKGSKIEFWTTPENSTTKTLSAVINREGKFRTYDTVLGGDYSHHHQGWMQTRTFSVPIFNNQTRWYKIVNYAAGSMLVGKLEIYTSRNGGFNQTKGYSEWRFSYNGFNNDIYGTGAENTSFQAGTAAGVELHFATPSGQTGKAIWIKIPGSIYGGRCYFKLEGIINNWQWDESTYETSEP